MSEAKTAALIMLGWVAGMALYAGLKKLALEWLPKWIGSVKAWLRHRRERRPAEKRLRQMDRALRLNLTRQQRAMKQAMQLLDEAAESIVNAYEIKTRLPRSKLSSLMDAETWMNANKALELGFCDEIMFQPAAHAEPAENSFVFSRRAVTNSLLDKLRAKAPKPPATPEQPKTKASDLDKRLALLQH